MKSRPHAWVDGKRMTMHEAFRIDLLTDESEREQLLTPEQQRRVGEICEEFRLPDGSFDQRHALQDAVVERAIREIQLSEAQRERLLRAELNEVLYKMLLDLEERYPCTCDDTPERPR